MAIVYRIQQKFSNLSPESTRHYRSFPLGPYSPWKDEISMACGYSTLRIKTTSTFQPEPEDDGIKNTHGTYGFSDLKQIARWFSRDLASLEWAGFCIAVYEVNERYINYGYNQLNFDNEHATLLEILPVLKTIKEHRKKENKEKSYNVC